MPSPNPKKFQNRRLVIVMQKMILQDTIPYSTNLNESVTLLYLLLILERFFLCGGGGGGLIYFKKSEFGKMFF